MNAECGMRNAEGVAGSLEDSVPPVPYFSGGVVPASVQRKAITLSSPLYSKAHGHEVERKPEIRIPYDLKDEVLAAELRRRGWHVEKPENGWMTCKELAERLGVAHSSVNRLIGKIDVQGAIPGLEVYRVKNTAGKTRVRAVRPSAEFYSLMRATLGREVQP